jgi:hypothetical protein
MGQIEDSEGYGRSLVFAVGMNSSMEAYIVTGYVECLIVYMCRKKSCIAFLTQDLVKYLVLAI